MHTTLRHGSRRYLDTTAINVLGFFKKLSIWLIQVIQIIVKLFSVEYKTMFATQTHKATPLTYFTFCAYIFLFTNTSRLIPRVHTRAVVTTRICQTEISFPAAANSGVLVEYRATKIQWDTVQFHVTNTAVKTMTMDWETGGSEGQATKK